jgi:hypothetical protein
MGLPSLDILSGATPTATRLLSSTDDLGNESNGALCLDTTAWLSQQCSQGTVDIPAITDVDNSPYSVQHLFLSLLYCLCCVTTVV